MLDQTPLTDVHRAFHPLVEYILFLRARGIFSRTDQTSLNKFKKIEIISSISSDHNGMKLGIIYKKKTWKIHKYVGIITHAHI